MLLQRIAMWVAEKVIVNQLANSPAFQRFAVRTARTLEQQQRRAQQVFQQQQRRAQQMVDDARATEAKRATPSQQSAKEAPAEPPLTWEMVSQRASAFGGAVREQLQSDLGIRSSGKPGRPPKR